MGGKRLSKGELQQIEDFVDEGLTNREISQKLGRSEAGIRNLRYRKRLIQKADDESKVLLQQRDELKRIVWTLQDHKRSLFSELVCLRKEKEKLESSINTDQKLLQGVLTQALINLKLQRPDLFILTNQDQLISLVRLLLGFITK